MKLRQPVRLAGFLSLLVLLSGFFACFAAVRPTTAATANRVGINVLNISDYGPDKAFADAVKSSRDWQTLSGGVPARDARGWPLQDAQIVVWGDAYNMNGTYKLKFTGQANVALSLVNGSINNLSYNAASNTTTGDVVINDSSSKTTMMLQFTNTNGGIKNLQLMRPLSLGSSQSYSFDTTFTTPYKNAIAKFSTIRFMDFVATNSNNQVNWSDRVLPSDYSQQQGADGYGWEGKGAAWEYAIQLANETGKDAWINVPVRATDAYVQQLALLWKNGGNGFAGLNPNLKLYIEYSNEVWNTAGAFNQSQQNHDAAVAEIQSGNSPLNFDGENNEWYWAWRRVGKRTFEISNIFRSVFGDSQMLSQVRPVLEWQQGDGQDSGGQALRMAEYLARQQGHPVNYYIYGGGGSAYYNPANDSDSLTIDNIWTSETMNVANWDDPLKTDADLVATYGIKRTAYEGGPGLDNLGHSESVKAAAVNDPRMKQAMIDHQNEWVRYGGDLLMYFNMAGDYEWGFTDDITNLSTPKYQAIDAINSSAAAPFGYRPAAPVIIDGSDWASNSRGWGSPSLGGSTNMQTGEWFSYSFWVNGTQNLNLGATINSGGAGQAEIWIDGAPLGTVNLSDTGGTAQDTPTFPVTLSEGLHGGRVKSLSGSFDVRYFKVTSSTNTACNNRATVTLMTDDGSCGTLRDALLFASGSQTKTVTISLPAGSTINLSQGITLSQGVSLSPTTNCGPNGIPPVTLKGSGSNTGPGVTLLGGNRLSNLWVRGFSNRQLVAQAGGNRLNCVKLGGATLARLTKS